MVRGIMPFGSSPASTVCLVSWVFYTSCYHTLLSFLLFFSLLLLLSQSSRGKRQRYVLETSKGTALYVVGAVSC